MEGRKRRRERNIKSPSTLEDIIWNSPAVGGVGMSNSLSLQKLENGYIVNPKDSSIL